MISASFFLWLAAGFAASTIFCSFFEWALHRFVMHKPVGGFTYPFERHTLVHHRIFRADHCYHNVVLTLADLCLGTLPVRSKMRFAQARGTSVPDVQPVHA